MMTSDERKRQATPQCCAERSTNLPPESASRGNETSSSLGSADMDHACHVTDFINVLCFLSHLLWLWYADATTANNCVLTFNIIRSLCRTTSSSPMPLKTTSHQSHFISLQIQQMRAEAEAEITAMKTRMLQQTRQQISEDSKAAQTAMESQLQANMASYVSHARLSFKQHSSSTSTTSS